MFCMASSDVSRLAHRNQKISASCARSAEKRTTTTPQSRAAHASRQPFTGRLLYAGRHSRGRALRPRNASSRLCRKLKIARPFRRSDSQHILLSATIGNRNRRWRRQFYDLFRGMHQAADSNYNVDESTIHVLQDVLTEVLALFPSKFIHIGGDEVDKQPWHYNPKAQARMHELGLKLKTNCKAGSSDKWTSSSPRNRSPAWSAGDENSRRRPRTRPQPLCPGAESRAASPQQQPDTTS